MTRILAFDTSLTSPGVAVLEVKRGKAVILAMSHVKPDAKSPYALRADIVESWATLFIAEHVKNGFTYVVREDFHGMSSAQNYPVFASWTGTEHAAHKFGLAFDKHVSTTKAGRKKTKHGMAQSEIKRIVVGKGVASKDEVADAVRKWTGYTGEFATDDCSDACAVGLAKLIEEGLIAE